jgi:hypothetical protein
MRCEICGVEITEENRSCLYDRGCVKCDRIQYELKDYAEDPFDYGAERRIKHNEKRGDYNASHAL